MAVLFGCFFSLRPLSAAPINCTYKPGGTNSWTDANRWMTCKNVFPDSNQANQFTATIAPNAATNVGLNSIVTVGGGNLTGDVLTLNQNATLSIANGAELLVALSANPAGKGTATINNGGTIGLNSTGGPTAIVIGAAANGLNNSGTVTLAGGGTIKMGDNPNNFIIILPDDTLLNEGIITGAGQIVPATGSILNNSGKIFAAGAANLAIELSGGRTASMVGLVNDGLLEATQGNTLELEDGLIDNFRKIGGVTVKGRIRAADGLVKIDNSTINGGTLSVIDRGSIELNDTSIDSAAVIRNSSAGIVEITGASSIKDSAIVNPRGGLVEIPSHTFVTLSGFVSLQGGGTLTMSGGEFLVERGTTATFFNDSLIRGSGEIGGIGNLTVINAGTIEATAGLEIHPNDAIFHNQGGTLLASPGGTLTLFGGTYNNGGTIKSVGAIGIPLVGNVRAEFAEINGGEVQTIAPA